ncbi:MAG TPA: TonB-dependent receptor [Terracidiphilus sp.]|nr:TonB-dependent receptor [Terracidiphilus sp.]
MSKCRRSVLALALFASASLVVTQAKAQAVYGSIFGTVTDPKGAAIVGATVTVTDESKGTAVTVTSNTTGDYAVPHLIPDVYDLKVTAKGFAVFETKGISVLADTAPRIDPTMTVGAAATTIEVNAETEPELKTDRADVATVFDEQQVASLPVQDENFTNLQLLLPGAQMLGWAHAADENPQASKQIQIDGQAFGGVAYELDGADNQDPILGIVVVNPTTDAVGDVKITTQDYDAEEGKAVSAIMSAQTRSGSNEFHGDIYDYRTGNANAARDPYDQAPGSIPAGLKNRFGGSIGGPILKDKFFFFGNAELQRQKVGTSAVDTLPTVLTTESCLGTAAATVTADSQGGNGCDLSQYLAYGMANNNALAWTIYDNLGNPNPANPPSAYPNNIIPRSEVGTPSTNPSLALLKVLEPFVLARNITYTPAANPIQAGLDQNFATSGTGLFNSQQWTERMDYTLNEKTHLFERFSRFNDILSGAVMFGSAGGPGFGINNYGGNSDGANDSDVVGTDIAINPKLLTDVRLGYLRYNVIDNKHDAGTNFATQLGIPGINLGSAILSGSPGFFVDNVPGGGGGTQGQPVFGDGLNVNRCNCPLIEREDQFQIVNNWTKVLGNHSIKLGADLRYGRNLRVPSDNDRDGLLYFHSGLTEDTSASPNGGLGWATFMLGQVADYNRYVSVSFNAKEFQKRTFFYVADSWRATHKLTVNYGGRLDLFWPESVNGAGNGSLMDISDGYLRVAGVGGIPSDMGWTVRTLKQLAPRLGLEYQLDPKTVIRAGYGRSFDMGVFGSIFGHTVTQNIPVLANQSVSQTNAITPVFALSAGPPAYTFPTVPSNGLLPNPGYSVGSAARQNPLTFPTLDAWNLAVQRSLTPTLSLTASYVGNKGTHTLGDGDGNTTNPNEPTTALPSQFSVTGQTMIYDNTVPAGVVGTGTNGYAANHTSTGKYLQRYYGGSLAACRDPNYAAGFPSGYTTIAQVDGDPLLQPGMCGWVPGVNDRFDNQNTEYDAFQATLNQQFHKGMSFTANYVWASAFDENTNWYTWSHSIAHMRDSNVRRQQLVGYGSYDLPFGRGKQFMPNANHIADLLVGGWQLSPVVNWASGLPFTVSYNECGANLPQTSICDPSILKGQHLHMHLSAFQPSSNPLAGTGTRTFFTAAALGSSGSPFYNPGLDNFGNAGQNTYFGPRYFGTDMALTKEFTIWEKVAGSFRFDAFNVFNHIAAGNPNGNVENGGGIGSGAQGYGQSFDFGPRQLDFSLRLRY